MSLLLVLGPGRGLDVLRWRALRGPRVDKAKAIRASSPPSAPLASPPTSMAQPSPTDVAAWTRETLMARPVATSLRPLVEAAGVRTTHTRWRAREAAADEGSPSHPRMAGGHSLQGDLDER